MRRKTLAGEIERHPDHVELEKDTAVGERSLIVGVVSRRVHVAQDHCLRIDAHLVDHDVDDVMSDALPARKVDEQGYVHLALSDARRPQRFRLVLSEERGDADFTDHARSQFLCRIELLDERTCQVVDTEFVDLDRMGRLEVPP